jgi:hypothetical protein
MAQDGVEARELKRLRAGIPSGTVRSLCHWSSARTRGFHPFTRRPGAKTSSQELYSHDGSRKRSQGLEASDANILHSQPHGRWL